MQVKKLLKGLVGAVVVALALAYVFEFAGCADDNGGKGGYGENKEPGTPTVLAEFYSLQDAYENQLISLEDLKNIAYRYNGGTRYNEEIMADFTPAEKVALSEETQSAIKWTRVRALRGRKRPDGTYLQPDATVEHVRIYGYYGTYNGNVAVMIEDDYSSYDCAMWMIEVEGVNIYYNSGNRITVWKQAQSNIENL